MVNVTKGVLVECDPAMKQFLLHLDETNALGRKFVIQDLDDTHLFISMEDEDSIWQTFPIKRRLKPNHILFEDGDLACLQNVKTIPVELSQLAVKRVEEFPCSISGCGKIFDTLFSYESHYNTQHRNCCSVCKRIFPSNYLLDLHLLEWHDAMFEIQASKQNMYKCLLESCKTVLQSCKTRKKHMIEKHHFPANYRFDRVKKNGPSKQPLKEKKSDNSMEVEEPVDKNPSKRIFSYKVPKNICFGQGSSRGFNRRGRGGKHWHQVHKTTDTSVNIENVVMKDLNDALES